MLLSESSDQFELEVFKLESAALISLHGKQRAGDEVRLFHSAGACKPGIVSVDLADGVVFGLHRVYSFIPVL